MAAERAPSWTDMSENSVPSGAQGRGSPETGGSGRHEPEDQEERLERIRNPRDVMNNARGSGHRGEEREVAELERRIRDMEREKQKLLSGGDRRREGAVRVIKTEDKGFDDRPVDQRRDKNLENGGRGKFRREPAPNSKPPWPVRSGTRPFVPINDTARQERAMGYAELAAKRPAEAAHDQPQRGVHGNGTGTLFLGDGKSGTRGPAQPRPHPQPRWQGAGPLPRHAQMRPPPQPHDNPPEHGYRQGPPPPRGNRLPREEHTEDYAAQAITNYRPDPREGNRYFPRGRSEERHRGIPGRPARRERPDEAEFPRDDRFVPANTRRFDRERSPSQESCGRGWQPEHQERPPGQHQGYQGRSPAQHRSYPMADGARYDDLQQHHHQQQDGRFDGPRPNRRVVLSRDDHHSSQKAAGPDERFGRPNADAYERSSHSYRHNGDQDPRGGARDLRGADYAGGAAGGRWEWVPEQRGGPRGSDGHRPGVEPMGDRSGGGVGGGDGGSWRPRMAPEKADIKAWKACDDTTTAWCAIRADGMLPPFYSAEDVNALCNFAYVNLRGGAEALAMFQDFRVGNYQKLSKFGRGASNPTVTERMRAMLDQILFLAEYNTPERLGGDAEYQERLQQVIHDRLDRWRGSFHAITEEVHQFFMDRRGSTPPLMAELEASVMSALERDMALLCVDVRRMGDTLKVERDTFPVGWQGGHLPHAPFKHTRQFLRGRLAAVPGHGIPQGDGPRPGGWHRGEQKVSAAQQESAGPGGSGGQSHDGGADLMRTAEMNGGSEKCFQFFSKGFCNYEAETGYRCRFFPCTPMAVVGAAGRGRVPRVPPPKKFSDRPVRDGVVSGVGAGQADPPGMRRPVRPFKRNKME